jgi:hypothetical protein
MRFIKLTAPNTFRSDTFVNVSEIAAIRLHVEGGNQVTKVVLKCGLEIEVSESPAEVNRQIGA